MISDYEHAVNKFKINFIQSKNNRKNAILKFEYCEIVAHKKITLGIIVKINKKHLKFLNNNVKRYYAIPLSYILALLWNSAKHLIFYLIYAFSIEI